MKGKATGKIIGLVIAVGLLIFTGIALHEYFKPTEAVLYSKDVIETENTKLTYANAEEHVLKDEEVHYLWACRMDNADCVYVRDYVIKPLADEVDQSGFDIIEFVDFSEAPDTVHYRSSTWGFDEYPAFIAVQNVEGVMQILNVLSWSDDNPISTEALKTWMHDNGIWNGEWNEETSLDAPVG